ncbi:hypothetical protein FP993_19505 [Salmonella enterica]|nr:hypothetical protein [Salmonella enterica]ECJ3243664.1 hypothetical protein [Salmonella enterica]
MSKPTYLNDLIHAYRVQKDAIQERCQSVYKSRPKDRWVEVCNAHNRRVIRQAKRSIGKSNRNKCRRTGVGMAHFLIEVQMWSTICRNNRNAISKEAAR